MKKYTFLLLMALGLGLASCQDPAKSRYYMDEGCKLMMSYSDFDEAERSFSKAIQYDKNNFEAYYYRGCARTNARKYEEAILDFNQAIALKPDYADAYFNLGRVYVILNDDDNACANYKLAQKHGRPNLEDYLKRCP